MDNDKTGGDPGGFWAALFQMQGDSDDCLDAIDSCVRSINRIPLREMICQCVSNVVNLEDEEYPLFKFYSTRLDLLRMILRHDFVDGDFLERIFRRILRSNDCDAHKELINLSLRLADQYNKKTLEGVKNAMGLNEMAHAVSYYAMLFDSRSFENMLEHSLLMEQDGEDIIGGDDIDMDMAVRETSLKPDNMIVKLNGEDVRSRRNTVDDRGTDRQRDRMSGERGRGNEREREKEVSRSEGRKRERERERDRDREGDENRERDRRWRGDVPENGNFVHSRNGHRHYHHHQRTPTVLQDRHSEYYRSVRFSLD